MSRYEQSPTPFPAHEHEQEVVGGYQDQHVEDEEVQVGEIAAETELSVHISDGIDVDDESPHRSPPSSSPC